MVVTSVTKKRRGAMRGDEARGGEVERRHVSSAWKRLAWRDLDRLEAPPPP